MEDPGGSESEAARAWRVPRAGLRDPSPHPQTRFTPHCASVHSTTSAWKGRLSSAQRPPSEGAASTPAATRGRRQPLRPGSCCSAPTAARHPRPRSLEPLSPPGRSRRRTRRRTPPPPARASRTRAARGPAPWPPPSPAGAARCSGGCRGAAWPPGPARCCTASAATERAACAWRPLPPAPRRRRRRPAPRCPRAPPRPAPWPRCEATSPRWR